MRNFLLYPFPLSFCTKQLIGSATIFSHILTTLDNEQHKKLMKMVHLLHRTNFLLLKFDRSLQLFLILCHSWLCFSLVSLIDFNWVANGFTCHTRSTPKFICGKWMLLEDEFELWIYEPVRGMNASGKKNRPMKFFFHVAKTLIFPSNVVHEMRFLRFSLLTFDAWNAV